MTERVIVTVSHTSAYLPSSLDGECFSLIPSLTHSFNKFSGALCIVPDVAIKSKHNRCGLCCQDVCILLEEIDIKQKTSTQ